MTTPTFRVASLQVSNVLRLSALSFAWQKDSSVLTLGGKNAAGKSSVINALAVALGGMALCPDEPLKRGEVRGFVEVDLVTLKVRREFWRDLLMVPNADGSPAYGETKSRLIVKNPDGVKQEPAQRLLDTFISTHTFDPMAFTTHDDKTQAQTLRQIVKLDTSTFEETRAIAYERRAVYAKEAKEKLAVLHSLPHYEGVPDAEVSLDALMAEQDDAGVQQDAVSRAQLHVQTLKHGHTVHIAQCSTAEELQADLDRNIAELTTKLAAMHEKRAINETIIAGMRDAATIMLRGIDAAAQSVDTLTKALPDLADLRTRMHAIEDTNSKIRANQARTAQMNAVSLAQRSEAEQDAIVQQADADKAAATQAVVFPVNGLGMTPNGVTFNGISFKQASTAEQIRVSVAIGFALNPGLKLLCVKNGNALDEDSFALLAKAAADAGGQVLMEIVTKDADDVSVFIEDGHTA